jgi:1-acyl-sn-glycerol-3-phosphate acyltransferase
MSSTHTKSVHTSEASSKKPIKVLRPIRKISRASQRRPWQENLVTVKAINATDPDQLDHIRLEKLAQVLTAFGRSYNGYSMHGEQNIPKVGPALIVFYHGLVPLDAWYFGLEYYQKHGRMIRALGDNFLFQTPGLKQIAHTVGCIPGDPTSAQGLLERGHLVAVSPGGVREAISGRSNNYKLLWKNRVGFAKLALKSGVPIIPGFTQNVEQLYTAPFAEHPMIQKAYEKTRLPLLPILGVGPLPFPVKLTTYIGEPILPHKGETPEKLAHRTKDALESLILKHQAPKQTIFEALLDRVEQFTNRP